jgi:hypothetical protein
LAARLKKLPAAARQAQPVKLLKFQTLLANAI